jgi:hypothetical protein
MAQDMANRVELTGSRIVIESVCGERGGILFGLHGVRVRAEKETIVFLLFPNKPRGASPLGQFLLVGPLFLCVEKVRGRK